MRFAHATAVCIAVASTIASSCARAPRGPSNACERAEGEWTGDDVESDTADHNALHLGREIVRHERWTIGRRYFDTLQGERRTREIIAVRTVGADRCTLTLDRDGRRREVVVTYTADGRLRARAPTGLVTAVFRRVN